jgi:hypothetical protein
MKRYSYFAAGCVNTANFVTFTHLFGLWTSIVKTSKRTDLPSPETVLFEVAEVNTFSIL